MKPSVRYSLLTLLAVLCVGVALSASRLKLPAFTQSAGASTQARPVVGGDEADDPANSDRSVFVQTDKMDYAPGEVIIVSGGGWDPGEAVTLFLHEEPAIHADRRVTVFADASGNIWDNQLMQDAHDGMLQLTATGRNSGLRTQVAFANPSANLDQWANRDATWVNGNLGASKAAYLEGDSIPYRLRFGSLTSGSHTVIIEWDTLKGGKHALDYITTFNRSVPHSPLLPGETNTAPDPCAGVTFAASPAPPPCSSASFDPEPIPAPQPGAPLSQVAGEFRLYGGSIVSLSCPVTPSSQCSANGYFVKSSDSDHPTSIAINFTASVTNPVLTWGGHIATRLDWPGASAINISGSPYHTRLVSLDGAGGNQDRSLSSDAAIFPASITIIKSTSPKDPTVFNFTTTGPDLSGFQLVDSDPATVPPGNTKVFSNILTFGNTNTRTVTETNPAPAFLLTGLACTSDTTPSGATTDQDNRKVTFALSEGENVSCTFTNTRQNATLTVIKHVDNTTNGDGGKTAANFTMSVNGASPSPASFAGDENGTNVSITPNTAYSVSEGAVTGYSQTSSTTGCSSATGIAPGGSAICTITNTTNGVTFTVIKHVDNTTNGDGGQTAANFTMSVTSAIGSPSPASFPGSEAGTPVTIKANAPYSVGEGAVTGYSQTSSTTGCSSATGIAPGGSATCTITNTADKQTPDIATTMKWVLKDSVTVSGLRPFASNAGDAYVIFTLYGPFNPADPVNDPPGCTSKLIFTSLQADGALTYAQDGKSGTASTNGFEVPGPGIYLWQAHYSGDADNNSQDTVCGSEKTEIKDLSSQ